jgi:hypothetical protein
LLCIGCGVILTVPQHSFTTAAYARTLSEIARTKESMKNIQFKIFPIIGLILYVPFHVLEEALGNFPLWMHQHYYGLPQPLSYSHWLINNGIFLLVLLIGLTFYLKNEKKYLYLGIGIIVWLFTNAMEHIVFSIKDVQLSPGFFTAILFLLLVFFSFFKLNENKVLQWPIIGKSILAGLSYWIISFVFIILIGNTLIKIFP